MSRIVRQVLPNCRSGSPTGRHRPIASGGVHGQPGGPVHGLFDGATKPVAKFVAKVGVVQLTDDDDDLVGIGPTEGGRRVVTSVGPFGQPVGKI